ASSIVAAANCPNLGLGLDAFHQLATNTALDQLDLIDTDKVFLVQLSDFMWRELPSIEERINTARHFRVFPGEGLHAAFVAEFVQKLDERGYRGDYSFEVFNDDYTQLPPARARRRSGSPITCRAGAFRCGGLRAKPARPPSRASPRLAAAGRGNTTPSGRRRRPRSPTRRQGQAIRPTIPSRSA